MRLIWSKNLASRGFEPRAFRMQGTYQNSFSKFLGKPKAEKFTAKYRTTKTENLTSAKDAGNCAPLPRRRFARSGAIIPAEPPRQVAKDKVTSDIPSGSYATAAFMI